MAESLETLLERWGNGDRVAGEHVLALVYAELRRLAAFYFRQEACGHTLQPTAVVNELFLKLCSGSTVQWKDRVHFFAVAARQMRRILIDHARRRKALRRNDTQIPIFHNRGSEPRLENLLSINDTLEGLENLDPRAAQVVELRVFGGLKEAEIATALNISVATVKRDWNFAKAWLVTRLR